MKKIFAIAFLAAAFIACSKDDDNNNDSPKLPEKQAPYILYFDAESKTIAAGQWGKVNAGNALYFKFGSVVGFTTTRSNDNWDASDVKFNPVEGTPIYNDYQNIPFYDGNSYNDGYLSSAAHHYGANVKDGLGDPCKLVGLKANATAKQIDDHNSGLRMVREVEFAEMYPDQETFVWTITPALGRWLTSNRTAETFLPMLLLRHNEGGISRSGVASYWSSLPGSNSEIGSIAVALIFDNERLHSSGRGYNREIGLPIRCVLDN